MANNAILGLQITILMIYFLMYTQIVKKLKFQTQTQTLVNIKQKKNFRNVKTNAKVLQSQISFKRM